jgi:phosphoenolpyruvate carboxylase
MTIADFEEQSTIFLWTDTQYVGESFFEDLKRLFKSFDFFNIFLSENVEVIAAKNNPIAQSLYIPTSSLALHNILFSRVKNRFHIVVELSPIIEDLSKKLNMFLSLATYISIVWIE